MTPNPWTPGPWRICDTTFEFTSRVIVATSNETVASINAAVLEAPMNARLIAAVPEMAELLERIAHPEAESLLSRVRGVGS